MIIFERVADSNVTFLPPPARLGSSSLLPFKQALSPQRERAMHEKRACIEPHPKKWKTASPSLQFPEGGNAGAVQFLHSLLVKSFRSSHKTGHDSHDLSSSSPPDNLSAGEHAYREVPCRHPPYYATAKKIKEIRVKKHWKRCYRTGGPLSGVVQGAINDRKPQTTNHGPFVKENPVMKLDFAAFKATCSGVDERLIDEHLSRLDDRYFSRSTRKDLYGHLTGLSKLSPKHPVEVLIGLISWRIRAD
jgi:hypothetical protein